MAHTQRQPELVDTSISIGQIMSGPHGEVSLYDHEAIEAAEASVANIRNYLQPNEAEPHEMPIVTRAKRAIVAQAEMLIVQQPDRAADIEEIIVHNSLGGHEITPQMGGWGGADKQIKTLRLLTLYERDPELAKTIVARNVAGFHGSHSGSLAGVLRHGLVPEAEARNREDIMIATGERSSFQAGGQTSISFGDWRNPETLKIYTPVLGPLTLEKLVKAKEKVLASLSDYKNVQPGSMGYNQAANLRHRAGTIQSQIDFIAAHPDSEEARLMLDNFPVAYGADVAGYKTHIFIEEMTPAERDEGRYIIQGVKSDIRGEFLVFGGVPAEKLAIIAVPEDRIKQVEAMVQKAGLDIKVTALSTLVED